MYILFILLFSFNAKAGDGELKKIPVGIQNPDGNIRQRVEELERLVLQLQQRVSNLESGKAVLPVAPVGPPPERYFCKVTAMGQVYTGIGVTKAIAMDKAQDKCDKAQGGTFHCKDNGCTGE